MDGYGDQTHDEIRDCVANLIKNRQIFLRTRLFRPKEFVGKHRNDGHGNKEAQ